MVLAFCILQPSMDKITNKSEYLECQSRRNNILIDGVPEERSETRHATEAKAKQLLAEKLDHDPKLIETECARRNGKYNEQYNRPRTIFMKLLRYKDKEEILKRGSKLKGSKIYVNEDLTERVRQKHSELWPQLKEARGNGAPQHFFHQNRLTGHLLLLVTNTKLMKKRCNDTFKPSWLIRGFRCS